MAQVKVVFRGGLEKSIGVRETQLEAATVSDVLNRIKSTEGKTVYKQAKAMLIVVNSISIIHRDLYRTTLHDGDTVSFLPLAAGG